MVYWFGFWKEIVPEEFKLAEIVVVHDVKFFFSCRGSRITGSIIIIINPFRFVK